MNKELLGILLVFLNMEPNKGVYWLHALARDSAACHEVDCSNCILARAFTKVSVVHEKLDELQITAKAILNE